MTRSMMWYSRASVGVHEAIAIGILFDLIERLSGVLEQDGVEPVLDFPELGGMDHDVFGAAFHAGRRLMDHDPRVGQGVAFAGRPGGQQDRAHRRALADAIGGHIAGDELHRVVDGQPGRDSYRRAN